MAPRRGGGGSGGGGGSSSSSSSCDDCTFTISTLYGHRYTALYSNADLYGQLVMYVIWSLALLYLLLRSRRTKGAALQAAIFFLLCACALLCVQFGLLTNEVDVPNAFRYVPSVVILLQRLAMPLLFLAVFAQLQAGKLSKILFYPALATYAILNVAYLILDFLVSRDAMLGFNDAPSNLWRLGDRDFGVTLTPHMVTELKLASGGDSGLSPYHIESRMVDFLADDDWESHRRIQIKIGVAADFLALALALFIGFWVGISLIRRRNTLKQSVWVLLAATGLVLATLFRVIVVTHYVLWNFKVITDADRWNDWIDTYAADPLADPLQKIVPPDGFLRGYRTTVNGFPVVEAVLEPLGIVLACAAVVHLLWLRKRDEIRTAPYVGPKT